MYGENRSLKEFWIEFITQIFKNKFFYYLLMSKKVYLAGPMTGLNYGEANSWRDYTIKEFAKVGIIGVSPLRCKEYLDNGKVLRGSDKNPLNYDRGIVTRDKWDITQNCDIVLANLLEAKKASIGTICEYIWADMSGKPVITVMESKGNIHDHPMIREATGFRVETLEEAIKIAIAILIP
jgi:nucleoside 2-deoxyribosyltransferase